MHYMKLLLTGIAICDVCGRTWELYRLRADEAICVCGASLSCTEAEPDPDRHPFRRTRP